MGPGKREMKYVEGKLENGPGGIDTTGIVAKGVLDYPKIGPNNIKANNAFIKSLFKT